MKLFEEYMFELDKRNFLMEYGNVSAVYPTNMIVPQRTSSKERAIKKTLNKKTSFGKIATSPRGKPNIGAIKTGIGTSNVTNPIFPKKINIRKLNIGNY